MASEQETFEEMIEHLKTRQTAFRMFLAGYSQRVTDEKHQPSSLRDPDKFAYHVKEQFEREWSKYAEE